MRKLQFFIAALSLFLYVNIPIASAIGTPIYTFGGGSGTTSPSGILYGDNGATNHLNSVTIGSNLTFSNGTLSATGGGGSSTFGTTSISASLPLIWNTATAVLSSLFGTTTNWGLGSNGLVMTGATGIPFVQATSSAVNLNISGNAGTVTNGVYTNTFNGLFDNRLSASSSVSGITTLPNLSLPYSQLTSVPAFDTFAYPFPLAATSTTLTFSGGLVDTASTTFNNNVFFPNLSQGLAFIGTNGLHSTVATSTLSASSPLTGSFTQIGSGGSLGCQTASGSQAGCLSSTDWTTFNNKGSGTLTAVTGTYPVQSSGGNTPIISLAFGTTTANIWSQLQTFTGGFLSSASSTINGGSLTLTPLGTAAGTFLAADPTGKIIATTTPSGSNSAFSPAANYATTGTLPSYTYAAGVITAVSNGALSVDGANPPVGSIILVKNESGACTSSSGGCNNGLYNVTTAGSAIAVFVLTRNSSYNSSNNVIPGIITYVISGATNDDDFWALTSAAPITIGTTALTYVEVSGGGASVTSVTGNANNTLTISPTSGAVIAGINLTNPNIWSGLQQFTGFASSTQLSVFTKAYFGGTATTTIDSAGNIVIPSGSSLTNTGVSNGCGVWASGVLGSTGSACATGTITGISVATANGFAGTSSGGATPSITLTTSVSGLLKGNGTAISAAALTDFPAIAANTVLANNTSGIAAPTAIATSSLFQNASGANSGLLTSTDWTTFNNKGNGTITSVTGTYPVQSTGGTAPVLSLAFGTTTANTWSALQTFSGAASSTNLTANTFNVGQTGTTTITSAGFVGIASSTPYSSLSVGSGTASSSITVAEYAYGRSGNIATSTSQVITPQTSPNIYWPIGTSATTFTLCNFEPGQHLTMHIQNPNAVAGAITWNTCSGYQLYWANQTVPTQTTGANLWDFYSFTNSFDYGSSTPMYLISGAQTPNF